jgi:hypothetical protein
MLNEIVRRDKKSPVSQKTFYEYKLNGKDDGIFCLRMMKNSCISKDIL